jgi:hypothetical protein
MGVNVNSNHELCRMTLTMNSATPTMNPAAPTMTLKADGMENDFHLKFGAWPTRYYILHEGVAILFYKISFARSVLLDPHTCCQRSIGPPHLLPV